MLELVDSPDYSCKGKREFEIVAFGTHSKATADQECLVRAAVRNVKLLLEEHQNLTGKIVARAKKDSKGKPWNAYVYSKDARGEKLSYVGHADAAAFDAAMRNAQHDKILKKATELVEAKKTIEEQLDAAKKSIESLKTKGTLKLPPGIDITLRKKSEKVPKKRHQNCDQTVAHTDADLERLVKKAVEEGGQPTVRSVSTALAAFENLPPKQMHAATLQEIAACYEGLARPKETSRNRIAVFQRVDAFLFGEGKPEYTENGIQQVASQFNFLESKFPGHTPMHLYFDDPTQGPFASLGCPGALAARNSCYRDKADADIQPFFKFFEESYKKGYFEPSRIPDKSLGASREYCEAHVGELAMLAQKGLSVFGPEVVQVFAAAPSFQGHARPSFSTATGQICNVLVGRQYAALGQLAAIRSLKLSARVPLHVSLVGQGAFNNPREVMITSFRSLLDAVKDFDVDVYFHGYGEADVANILHDLEKIGVKITEVMQDVDFYRHGYKKYVPPTARGSRFLDGF
jgi:hypothetical protein